eukprot:TRINITY_DN35586_c0_g1_i1.p1 TRINITY_DN35586_c0_g1~~TRINITY_DN35586_c0_g1_i1.p1  ORF type:complete len:703 (+),score=156.37 TRINITY_DN35586_c0_g1_i1:52-2160(+)
MASPLAGSSIASAGTMAALARPGTADALAPAAAAGAAAPGAHLVKKVQKALSLRIDSQSSRDSLKCLSGFYDDNTVHARRNLRSTIEGQSLVLHEEFVNSFEKVASQVEGLERLVNALDSACGRAAAELRRSKTETQGILERASALRHESKVIDDKQQVLSKFLGKFKLSDQDTQLLKSGDKPINDEFFSAFVKLEEVRASARHMLNACGQQTSGVDILHETSELLEASYERMFVWVQQQCRGPQAAAVAKQSATELDTATGAVLKKALALLAERPVYFNHCIRDISRVRRQALVQRFFDALSQGDGGARPIELQACDPERYVGDMLAWIHLSVVSEREALSVLMGKGGLAADSLKHGRAGSGGIEAAHAAAEAEPGLALVSFDEILNFTLDGLSTPFGNRVKQALESQTSIVVVYKVAQVLSFFARTLEELLPASRPAGSDAAGSPCCLVALCKDLHAKTMQAFLEMWEAQAQKLRQGVVGVYVSDLSAPPFVMEAVNTLTEVLSVYESSLVPEDEREADFTPILCAAFDPLLNHCQQVAQVMDSADGQVFLVNCVAAMQTPLKKHEKFTARRVAMYAALLEDQIRLLVESQAAGVLAKLGLAERLKALREKPATAPISAVPELHPVSLGATLRSFYNSLFTLGGALALPILERISSRSLRSEARAGVAKQIAAAYEELYEGIKELGVATHTPDQVRTLLE